MKSQSNLLTEHGFLFVKTWLLVACGTGIYEICGIKSWVNHDNSQVEEIYFSSNIIQKTCYFLKEHFNFKRLYRACIFETKDNICLFMKIHY